MNYKRLLIVDDSEIDREVLKNILSSDFAIIEADNGYSGLEIILSGKPKLDAVMLDISMPVLDGFNVLQLMSENDVKNLPVILITAEATKSNVHKAIQYNVSGFISKPFDPELILERMRTMFDIQAESSGEIVLPLQILSENDITETHTYISKLKEIYKRYLRNNNIDDSSYVRVSAITEMLLEEYAVMERTAELDSAHIDLISRAAYFYDIGKMGIPDSIARAKPENLSDLGVYESHTNIGADIIWLNHAPSCRYFVHVCADICMHHHERYDGEGFPHCLKGDENSVYTQICSVAIKFERMFSKRPEFDETQFDFVVKEMSIKHGEFSHKMLTLLRETRTAILAFYKKNYVLKNKEIVL
jgi:putative two-component system response regulator